MATKNALGRISVAYAPIFLRAALGCLFIYSSIPKTLHSFEFLSDLYNYELVGPRVGVLVAAVLPWVELVTGACLVGGCFVGGALLVCCGMALVFIFAISWALWQGLDISCGCFGSGTEKITYMTLLRAIGILLASVLAYGAALWSGQLHPLSR
jgi:uncharacterized membrane protein YphA (DoxX/SURF4 family)